VQSRYEERYLESLGARPTRSALALVSKLSLIADDGIELRLRKVGYRQDEVHVSPAPPQVSKKLLGCRRLACARTMVRIAAANEMDFRCQNPQKSSMEPQVATVTTSSSSAAAAAAAVAEDHAEQEHSAVGDQEAKGLSFEATISRFSFPYCLAAKLEDELAQQAAVDLRMPARLGDLPAAVPTNG
jgi:hypothetical protein